MTKSNFIIGNWGFGAKITVKSNHPQIIFALGKQICNFYDSLFIWGIKTAKAQKLVKEKGYKLKDQTFALADAIFKRATAFGNQETKPIKQDSDLRNNLKSIRTRLGMSHSGWFGFAHY